MLNIIVQSEPGFEPALDAELVGTAADYIHRDPDSSHMRLDAHGVVKYALSLQSQPRVLVRWRSDGVTS